MKDIFKYFKLHSNICISFGDLNFNLKSGYYKVCVLDNKKGCEIENIYQDRNHHPLFYNCDVIALEKSCKDGYFVEITKEEMIEYENSLIPENNWNLNNPNEVPKYVWAKNSPYCMDGLFEVIIEDKEDSNGNLFKTNDYWLKNVINRKKTLSPIYQTKSLFF